MLGPCSAPGSPTNERRASRGRGPAPRAPSPAGNRVPSPAGARTSTHHFLSELALERSLEPYSFGKPRTDESLLLACLKDADAPTKRNVQHGATAPAGGFKLRKAGSIRDLLQPSAAPTPH